METQAAALSPKMASMRSKNEWSVIRIEFATSPPQIRPVEVPNEMCIEMSCEYNIYVKCVGRSAKTTHKGSDSHLLHGNIICVVFWDGLWTAGSVFFLRVETCEKKRRPLGFEKWQGSFNGYHVPVMGIHLPAVAGQQSVWPRLESPSSQVRICSFDISHLPASKSQVSRNLRNFLPKFLVVSKHASLSSDIRDAEPRSVATAKATGRPPYFPKPSCGRGRQEAPTTPTRNRAIVESFDFLHFFSGFKRCCQDFNPNGFKAAQPETFHLGILGT